MIIRLMLVTISVDRDTFKKKMNLPYEAITSVFIFLSLDLPLIRYDKLVNHVA